MSLSRCVLILACIVGPISSKLLDLSCDDIKSFVDAHNLRRNLVAQGNLEGQPGAKVMYKMSWDDELAQKAEDWARLNNFVHNSDRTIASARFETGENLYFYQTTKRDFQFNPEEAVSSWFNENEDYYYKVLEVSDFTSPIIVGHYTQIVWADTVLVGCAISNYLKDDKWNTFFVVCNYGPGGNIIGKAPYQIGGPSELTCHPEINNCDTLYGSQCGDM